MCSFDWSSYDLVPEGVIPYHQKTTLTPINGAGVGKSWEEARHTMAHKQQNLDVRKYRRKSNQATPSPLPSLMWLLVGVFVFVALVLAFTSR